MRADQRDGARRRFYFGWFVPCDCSWDMRASAFENQWLKTWFRAGRETGFAPFQMEECSRRWRANASRSRHNVTIFVCDFGARREVSADATRA